MSYAAVLELIDAAPVFAEPKPLTGDELRVIGLAELGQVLARVKAAQGDQRRPALDAAGEQLGQLVGAGALHEDFAKAALEEAAAGIGLVRELGARPLKSAIEAAIKGGKKNPRDFSLHGIADLGVIKSQPRPGEAGNSAAVRIPSSRDDNPPPDAREDAPPSAVAAPAPPMWGEDASSQMGASAGSDVDHGGAGEVADFGGDREPPRDRDDEEDDYDRNIRLAFYPLTDLGNAERFRERYRNKLLWCPALGWLVWDGKRWSRNGADELVKLAEHATVRAIQDEAEAVSDSGRKDIADAPRGARDWMVDAEKGVLYSDKIARWGRSSEAANKLGALSKRGAPYFAVSIEKLDADKFLINVNNGTLVVRRSDAGDCITFKPHDPADLITKLAPVKFDPAAPCPAFDAFLAKVQPLPEMRTFLMQWLGLSLTGDTSEQMLAFLYGKGGNGKSVLTDAVSYVAGDYGETVPIETFIDQGKARSAGQATPDLAILPGVRMLRTSEPEKGSKLAEAMVKLVTGGEPIQARHLNRDFFKFYPQFKLTMSGNYRPTISGTDEGIWRRVRLVPFNVTVPKEERDPHLIDKLRAEASGILNRLLDGLRSWLDGGLREPEDVVQATAEYRATSDPLGRFLAACVESSPGDRVQSSVLYEVYEAWCKASGENAWKHRGFSLAMDERGFKRKQSNTMWWLDVKLLKTVNDFVDHQGNPLRLGGDGEPPKGMEAADMEF